MSFNKHDIKSLPFANLFEKIREETEINKEHKLSARKALVRATNKARRKAIMDMAANDYSEAGLEGIEEAIAETIVEEDPDEVKLTSTDVAEATKEAEALVMPKFLETFNIAASYTWIMPQLVAYFGNWKAAKGEDGLYNGVATLKHNIASDDYYGRGLWHLAMWSRSDLIGGKDVRLYKVGEYNNLVPLVLNGFRTSQDIPYSSWSKEGLRWVVDSNLVEAMLADVPTLSTEELLDIRQHGLKIKTGAKAGQSRDPRTTATLYGMADLPHYPVKGLPRLALVMMAQVWCAHPANRTKHMVLDPKNWDIMPEPLIDVVPIRENLFTTTIKTGRVPSGGEPW